MTNQISLFASDPSLADDPLHHGQWRLARVEVVNWGTFSGYHVLPVSRRGLLITGESGSGKSSLLDAVTTVLTPPRARKLNAAAKSDGARGDDRTVYSYIRGAWNNETDVTGEVSSSFLRPKRAVWSGVLLRYERNPDRPDDAVNLVALFHLKAGSVNRDGFSEMYARVRGDCELPQFAPYAENGIERAKFNREWKDRGRGFGDHSTFAAHFTQLMGMQGPKTLELLHRTQAAKNFGSLDDLFRNFMLERPQTFDQADEAVAQFSALDQAYERVVDQRKQMQHLAPLEDLDVRFREADESLKRTERLKEVLPGYTEQRAVEAIDGELERLRRESDRLASEKAGAESESEQAKQALAQAQAALDGAGGFALDSAEKDLLMAQQQLGVVEGNRSGLESRIGAAGYGASVPQTLEDWGSFVRSVQKAAREEQGRQQELRDEAGVKFARKQELAGQIEAVDGELRHLRRSPTNIPRALNEVRVSIAEHLGVAPSEVPFVGELIQVRGSYAAWQGAIERVLGSQAKTLLVAHEYARAVSRFVDGAHLGLRFEFEDVPDDVEVPAADLPEQSLVSRVEVKQHDRHPEYSRWVHRLLRTKFDYRCVDSPDDLPKHRKALTIAGQVKNKNRYIKDDRYKVGDRKRWILGSDNEAKQRELQTQKALLEAELRNAAAATDEVTSRIIQANDLVQLAASLEGETWEAYDVDRARGEVEAARRHCDQLRKGSKKIADAQRVRDEARARNDAADEALRRCTLDLERAQGDIERLSAEREGHVSRLDSSACPARSEADELDREFSRVRRKGAAEGVAWLYQASNDVLRRLDAQGAKASEDLRRAKTETERIIADYRRDWPAASADLRPGFEGREEYLRVYRRIVASGLPAYEQKFLKVLHDFSQDQITVLSTTIRNAIHEVRDRIRQVNSSLLLSEYAPGIHLQIDVKESRSRQASDFLADLKAITEGSWNDEDIAAAERRYLNTSKIISRLKASDYADQKWKADCIDTRRHVSFIAKEIGDGGDVVSVHANDAGLSGGQKQKLVVFCLAAALRYQLADEAEPIPSYGTVVLDEAFDKADHRYANTAMDIFEAFGFHMVLATPMKLLQTAEGHIGGIAHITCRDRKASSIGMVQFEADDEAGEGAGADAAAEGARA